MIGANAEQTQYWKGFDRVTILPFDKAANDKAIEITRHLKATNKLIEVPDIFYRSNRNVQQYENCNP